MLRKGATDAASAATSDHPHYRHLGTRAHPMKKTFAKPGIFTAMCLAAVACGGNGVERSSEDSTDTVSQAVQLGTWVASNYNLPRPANAFLAGKDPVVGDLFFCRAWYQNGLHPGKYWNGSCYIPWGGSEITFTDSYEVLTNVPMDNFFWTAWNAPPVNKVDGGFVNTPNGQQTLYLCRAYVRNVNTGAVVGYTPGKIWQGACNAPYNGVEGVNGAYWFDYLGAYH
jgi:hypothetical protein